MDNHPLQLAYRTQKAIGIFNAAPDYNPLPGFLKPEGNLRCFAYSPCGRLFAWASPDCTTVIDTALGVLLTELPLANVLELAFSPQGTFLITWERPGKDEAGDATKNLKVWRSVEEGVDPTDKLPLGSFVQKSQGGWNLQYTSDERFCARMVTNEVHLLQSHDLGTAWNRLRVEGVADFSLAPGPTHSIAVFIPERKGQPAAVKVFNIPHFASPVSQKTFFKGDKVQMKWNKQGTSLLVLAQTDVDKSNKSYYGETTLYLLSTNGSFDARITLDKEGPIHDVAWSPNSKEFGVVYGYMPAKTTIFNHRAVVTHSFPIGPRNTIIFSPSGRFALVAGFGNLAGQIDVYDLEKDFRKVCTIESGNPSVCQWSPDGRYIVTATTSPRLRVDNGIKLWHVGGKLVYNEDMVELYSVAWRPWNSDSVTDASDDPLATIPTPHESAVAYLGTVKTPSKQAGVYRPPGARGLATPLHFKREDEGGAAHTVSNGTPSIGPNGFGRGRRAVPGAEAAEPGPASAASRLVPGSEPVGDVDHGVKAATKNKKKRNKKKDADGIAISQDSPYILSSDGDRTGPEIERAGYGAQGQYRISGAQARGISSRQNQPTTHEHRDEPHNAQTAHSLPPDVVPTPLETSQNPLTKRRRY
jgi:translation initiation factor 2A